jgi:hypothetical protein
VSGRFPGGLGRGDAVQAVCRGRLGGRGETIPAQSLGGFGLGPQAAGAGRSGTAQGGALFGRCLVGRVRGARVAAVGCADLDLVGVVWGMNRTVTSRPACPVIRSAM